MRCQTCRMYHQALLYYFFLKLMQLRSPNYKLLLLQLNVALVDTSAISKQNAKNYRLSGCVVVAVIRFSNESAAKLVRAEDRKARTSRDTFVHRQNALISNSHYSCECKVSIKTRCRSARHADNVDKTDRLAPRGRKVKKKSHQFCKNNKLSVFVRKDFRVGHRLCTCVVSNVDVFSSIGVIARNGKQKYAPTWKMTRVYSFFSFHSHTNTRACILSALTECHHVFETLEKWLRYGP